MNNRTVSLSVVMLATMFVLGAVPKLGAASSLWAYQNHRVRHTTTIVPSSVPFRVDRNKGLLVQGWIDGDGPFTFAIDTGAGLAIISESMARRLQLRSTSDKSTIIAGISGNEITAQRVTLKDLALGTSDNLMPGPISAAIAQTLPAGVDIVLDPTDAFSPFGYTIDFGAQLLTAFDAANAGLNLHTFPIDGTIVPWIREAGDRRPFVRLGDGNVALVDTGSSFGLAISSSSISASNRRAQPSRDLGGGSFRVHRVAPSNVSIGSLSLNGIPTDILSGTDLAAPRLLGRDALNPFIISFDPLHRLIEIAPSVHDKYRPR